MEEIYDRLLPATSKARYLKAWNDFVTDTDLGNNCPVFVSSYLFFKTIFSAFTLHYFAYTYMASREQNYILPGCKNVYPPRVRLYAPRTSGHKATLQPSGVALVLQSLTLFPRLRLGNKVTLRAVNPFLQPGSNSYLLQGGKRGLPHRGTLYTRGEAEGIKESLQPEGCKGRFTASRAQPEGRK